MTPDEDDQTIEHFMFLWSAYADCKDEEMDAKAVELANKVRAAIATSSLFKQYVALQEVLAGTASDATMRFIESGVEINHWAAKLMAISFERSLGEAPNGVEFKLELKTKTVLVTIERTGGKSPIELLNEAKKEIEALKAERDARAQAGKAV